MRGELFGLVNEDIGIVIQNRLNRLSEAFSSAFRCQGLDSLFTDLVLERCVRYPPVHLTVVTNDGGYLTEERGPEHDGKILHRH